MIKSYKFEVGDLIKLKPLTLDEWYEMGYTNSENIKYLLTRKFFKIVKISENGNQVFYYSAFWGQNCYFLAKYIDLYKNKTPKKHNHPLTMIFK